MDFYIYILYSKTIDKFYLGYSSDPWIRYVQHLNNLKEKYTGKAKDWEKLVAQICLLPNTKLTENIPK